MSDEQCTMMDVYCECMQSIYVFWEEEIWILIKLVDEESLKTRTFRNV